MESKTRIKISIVVALLLILGFAFWKYVPIQNFSTNFPDVIKNFASSTVATQIQNIQQEVFSPPPLKSTSPKIQNSILSASGIVYWTNINRQQNGGFVALNENALLSKAAKNKLDDMFKNQYFEHESPNGGGPADLAKVVGYEYLSIGENLALGYFKNNQELVTAWMNSPGHRANILNSKFTEIGVAVGKGFYKGEETWLAVQEFGRPKESCPSIDEGLKVQIVSLQSEIDTLQPQILELKVVIDSMDPKTKEDYDTYNAKVAEYNGLVKIFNFKVDTLKLDTSKYNAQVSKYNICLGS